MKRNEGEIVMARTLAALLVLGIILFFAWRLYKSNPDIKYLDEQRTSARQ